MWRIVRYPSEEAEAFLRRLEGRNAWIEEERTVQRVREILERVRREGDAAVLDYTRQFDCPQAELDSLRVPESQIERAWAEISAGLRKAIREAVERIRAFHAAQLPRSWFTVDAQGSWMGQRWVPLERVGMHIPAASAPLVSSLLMAAIPAQLAGVRELVATIPPRRDGEIHPAMLAAAYACEVREVYRCGGAQAIAAMAFGTETIRPVDKIVGPGSPYSQLAKKEVFGVVDVDKLAGPSEVLVIADESARPDWIAADLLSQAEHSDDCSALLITPAQELAQAVGEAIGLQLARLPRRGVARASLERFGGAFWVDSLETAVALSDRIAPEHVEVHTREPMSVALRLQNAGGIFLGEWTPEALGDYAAGPNHILPTGGTARFSSACSVLDFMKRINLLQASAGTVADLTETVVTLAEAEELQAHAEAMRIRTGREP
ncbi:MAG: histidinol dehydrogenase [Candidatus Poribacteria bacterium]|nr:MAG: histidinol dehydrogenase [Candidatus Poribacteria bacterium]